MQRVAAAGYGFPHAIMKQMKRQRIVASDRSAVSSWGRDRHIRRCIPECGGRRKQSHLGLRSRCTVPMGHGERDGGNAWVSAMLVEQTGQMPGIASVHCIGRTDDGKVMAVQRAGQTPYAPGRWSISFEEQLTTVDTTSTREDPFSAAARRGFAEEFGIPAGTVSICVIAAILETDILNRAIFALIDSDATAKEDSSTPPNSPSPAGPRKSRQSESSTDHPPHFAPPPNEPTYTPPQHCAPSCSPASSATSWSTTGTERENISIAG